MEHEKRESVSDVNEEGSRKKRRTEDKPEAAIGRADEPDGDDADLDSLKARVMAGEDVITEEIMQEEKKLQEAQEEKDRERLREPATEEYEKMQVKRKLSRFNELLGKAGQYTNFLMAKLEEQRKQKVKAAEEAKAGEPAQKRQQAEEDGEEEEVVEIEDDEEALERRLRTLQPKLLTGGVLREYQRQGFEWLVSLYENGLNGILGDEMGLGKTIQCISLIAHLVEKGVAGPFLVVAPLGTIGNWVSEFEKFAPSIMVVLYHGSPDYRTRLRAKKMKIGDKRPVVITSFEIVMQDRKFLAKYKWKYIIVDEGHRLKNLNSKLIRDLKSLPSSNRLLLTGTPLQNNLAELWSLLNFLLPNLFDDVDLFLSWFDFSRVVPGDADGALGEQSKLKIIDQLHQILKPFLLRRLKSHVEADLPKKREYLVYAPMTPRQRQYYDALLNNDLRKVLLSSIEGNAKEIPSASGETEKTFDEGVSLETTGERVKRKQRGKGKAVYKEISDAEYFKKAFEMAELEDGGSGQSSAEPPSAAQSSRLSEKAAAERHVQSLRLQNMMVQFRKVCNHPYLFNYPALSNGDPRIDEELVQNSGKFLLLDALIPKLIERGHKILVFSQFTSMLDILGDYFALRKLEYCRIDGGVNYDERQAEIANFNTRDDLKIFLLSTRAGGLGINLTAADTCIIYDSDWNPQMDLQAQDRVHRIGQKRPVIVYRFCTSGSLESVMLEKATAKRRLERIVIHKERFKKIDNETAQLALAELAEILRTEEGEKVDIADSNNVISPEDLERILDRSDEAFRTKTVGKGFSVYDPQQSEAFSSE